ncbi:hypothetical protein L5515_018742 [Caenorhabditis briggsae]|uniref:Uncharacterized protein n=1 Tax=Caenorhabditis briggsae TaxID=6238 RepID=A0AAE9FI00_CAEBR|nr:hypothetical protein L5515_018742 [Caenorhabditis briggsae]
MNKNGTELFYCVERERRARCDAAYHFDRMNNTFTVKKQHVRHDEDFVRTFIDYLIEYYMDDTVRYPPKMWSCTERTMNRIHRTTNVVESWHKLLSFGIQVPGTSEQVKFLMLLLLHQLNLHKDHNKAKKEGSARKPGRPLGSTKAAMRQRNIVLVQAQVFLFFNFYMFIPPNKT